MSTTFQKKYRVLCKIGEGSFSDVMKCQERESGTLFAAKRLKRIYYSMGDIFECNEIRAMSKIGKHPNILSLIESHYDPLPGNVILIFELMDTSMCDYIKTRTRGIPESRVKNYLYQVLKGLEHLHINGIFHRDIKPENILLKRNRGSFQHYHKSENVKLADLGSIRGIYSRPPYTEYISTRWYRSPECLLTVGYYGSKMDVWATGCVFYELLTLKPLFPGANEVDQLAKIHEILGSPKPRLLSKFHKHKSRNCLYSFPTQAGTGVDILIPNISRAGREILKRMLVYDPEQRANVRRILEHRYFNDFSENRDAIPHRRFTIKSPRVTPSSTSWMNPPILSSYLNNERRRRHRIPGNLFQKITACSEDNIANKIFPNSEIEMRCSALHGAGKMPGPSKKRCLEPAQETAPMKKHKLNASNSEKIYSEISQEIESISYAIKKENADFTNRLNSESRPFIMKKPDYKNMKSSERTPYHPKISKRDIKSNSLNVLPQMRYRNKKDNIALTSRSYVVNKNSAKAKALAVIQELPSIPLEKTKKNIKNKMFKPAGSDEPLKNMTGH